MKTFLCTALTAVAISLSGCAPETTDMTNESNATTSDQQSEKQSTSLSPSEPAARDFPTLSKQLADKAAASKDRIPEDMRKKYAQGIETVRASDIERTAKQVGDAAIDAELTGWDGETVKLSQLWSEAPIVLMWYRGGWCPYCNIQLQAMQRSMDELENAGARLVVLTPELPEKAKETAETNNSKIVAFHDNENALARKYGIVFQLPEPIIPAYRDKLKLPEYNGNDNMELPLAATYVIDKSGQITYAFLDADYKKRADPTEVIEAVKAATK